MKKLTIIIIFILYSSLYGEYFFEGNINLGYTIIDFDKLLEETENSEAEIEDWNQLSYGINLSYYFLNINSFHFGVSLDYQFNYWYSVEVTYGEQTIYREYDKRTTSISPIIKLDCPNSVYISASPVFILSDSLNLGASLSLGYYFSIRNLTVPVGIRLDLKNYEEVQYFPILLQAGIRQSL